MKLTKDINLSDLCVTETGIQNAPEEWVQHNLLFLADYLLQKIIDRFGIIAITSAFRCEAVNARIGGAKNSQHLYGEASDFIPTRADIFTVFEWCRKNLIYGQLIFEQKSVNGKLKRWIHISLPRITKPNMMALVYDGKDYLPWSAEVISKIQSQG
jgi:hypothetical protein